MLKTNFTNNQRAFEYVLYMIAASYFEKAVCMSKQVEQNFLLQYKEQKVNKQYQMEDICIKFMEELVKKVPSDFFGGTVKVKLHRTKSGLTEIMFWNKKNIIVFQAIYEGKKTKIQYQIWKKNSKQRD